MQCLCRAEFCSFQHNRNLHGAGTDFTEVVPNGNAIKPDFNWKCRKGLLLRNLCNQWRHSLNTMGGNPCFPCSPVSEHRCGCWGERAQARPRFLSVCSFLHRTMTGTSASQAMEAEHAENPFPQAKMGRTSQPRAAVLLQGRAQLQAGCHRARLGVCQHCHRGSEKNSNVEVSLHILQQETLIWQKASKDVLFAGFPSTVSTMQRECFGAECCRLTVFWGLGWGGEYLLININYLTEHSNFKQHVKWD